MQSGSSRESLNLLCPAGDSNAHAKKGADFPSATPSPAMSTTPAQSPTVAWNILMRYFDAYYNGKFILRDGSTLSRVQLTSTTVPVSFIVNNETVSSNF
jgi:hypothetical protein